MRDDRCRVTSLILALVLVLAGASTAEAFSSGITTLSFGVGGCNQCHFGGTVPTVMLTGPTAVLPSSTNEYTFEIFEVGLQTHAGLNVSALDGVLATGGGNSGNTQVLVGTGSRNEVTHTAPKMAAAGVTTFSFFWTAPASFTGVSLNAWGNAVNFNGMTDGDRPAFASLAVFNANGTPTPTATPTPTPLLCDAAPVAGCRTPTIGDKALVMLKDNSLDDGKDRLLWKWLKGAATTKAEFGNPTTTDTYKLCIYDGGGLVMSATADAGGTCAGKPCWSEKTTNFKFKDKDLTPDGVLLMLLKEGIDGKAKIIVKGKGLNLGMPPDLSLLTSPLVVQLNKSTGGVCWEAQYTFPPALKNDAEIFKDKAD